MTSEVFGIPLQVFLNPAN